MVKIASGYWWIKQKDAEKLIIGWVPEWDDSVVCFMGRPGAVSLSEALDQFKFIQRIEEPKE